MASIVNYNDGLKRIEFTLTPNGPRKMVRLGRVNAQVARTWIDKINAILADKLANRPHDAEISNWLGGLDETMLVRLRDAGLAEGVGLAQTTLKAFLDQYFGSMTGKDATKIFYGHTHRNLEKFLGGSKLMRNITAADADAFRAWLIENQKLSLATVARRVIAARTMWRKAMRWKLTSENPFSGIKAGHQLNESRKVFVAKETIEALIADVPDTEWAAIIALSRYAGLRVPSELFQLRWGDVDFDRGRITVTSPKTEHHEGHGSRIIPLFTELRPYLEKLFAESASEGAVYVVSKHRLGGLNLRQQMMRLIRRAGVTPWPKLFHNLRASRETELMREYDLATVCKWIGNSPAVAAKHYATSVDLNADFQRASAIKGVPAAQSGDGSNQAQQKAQYNAQQSRQDGHIQRLTSNLQNNEKAPENRGFDDCCPLPANADKSAGWAIQDSNL